MPTFEKSSPAVVERFHDLAALVPDATQRQMFGYPSCVLGGNMFMGLFHDDLVMRLDEDDRRQLVEAHGARTFEPMAGRPMKEWVVLPPALVEAEAVQDWVARSYAYAQTLPPKPAKAAKAAAKKATKKGTKAAARKRPGST